MPTKRPTRFTGSRQRLWQLSRISRGKCSICGVDPLYKDDRCMPHYLLRHVASQVGIPKRLDLMRRLAPMIEREIKWAVKRDRRRRAK